MSTGTAISRNARASSLTVAGNTGSARQLAVVTMPNRNALVFRRNMLILSIKEGR
jgi:hypothetical protein